MRSLDNNKVFHVSDIRKKILNKNIDFLSPFKIGYVNKSVSLCASRSILKLAGITPVYEKDLQYEKSNYRLIKAAPNLSKIFENVLYDQISLFFEFYSVNIKLVSGKARKAVL